MTVWMQSLRGEALELQHPTPAQVDFRQMAEALSRIIRYTGAAVQPVTVAQHLIICAEIADIPERPYVILHDGREERTGDKGRPQLDAHIAIAVEMFGPTAEHIVKESWEEFGRRHDLVIWEKAGLAPPDAAMRAAVKRIDNIALATEKRDFLLPCRRAWTATRGIAPAKKVFRYMPPDEAADRLYALFRTYLPSLSGH